MTADDNHRSFDKEDLTSWSDNSLVLLVQDPQNIAHLADRQDAWDILKQRGFLDQHTSEELEIDVYNRPS